MHKETFLFVIICIINQIQSQVTKCPNIVSRLDWGARARKEIEYSLIPLEYVVIHHTVTPTCKSDIECSDLLRNIQDFHMNDLNFHDIGYNFMIGDGKVYEGVGWGKTGAHVRGYNSKSIGIAFIGTFNEKLPSDAQLQAAKDLLKCGVELGELDRRYKLIGAMQVTSTRSPGLKLFQEIQNWPNFVANP